MQPQDALAGDFVIVVERAATACGARSIADPGLGAVGADRLAIDLQQVERALGDVEFVHGVHDVARKASLTLPDGSGALQFGGGLAQRSIQFGGKLMSDRDKEPAAQ